LLTTRHLSEDETACLTTVLQERFCYLFNIAFSCHEEIPRSAGDKFEDYKDEREPGN